MFIRSSKSRQDQSEIGGEKDAGIKVVKLFYSRRLLIQNLLVLFISVLDNLNSEITWVL